VTSPKRILALDGGGIKGVFAASFLKTIEEQLGSPIDTFFDLICGTSTGAIIALALGLGRPAGEVLRLYEELGTEVFKSGGVRSWVINFFQRKYDSTPLRNALTKTFGASKLGDSKVRLVIPSFNLQTCEIHLYKTYHHQRFSSDHKTGMVSVALASAAAPTYFPVHRSSDGTSLLDGGMWANNPVAVAAVEAVGVLGWDPTQTHILSVGCTEPALDISGGSRFWSGKLYWANKVSEIFLAGQSSGALGMARWLLGVSNVHRVTETVGASAYSLDGINRVTDLKGLGASSARHELARLKDVFFTGPADQFIPLSR
jgi:hypothetical protein